ncbi:DUF5947 family protein [Streptomyces sp. NPDC056160]|uniref:DUF5947 family protein n=1 Tax=Streptomyces sp. NPDC056160 TaxID=3345731 RepID=UPI0035D5B929
MAGTLARLIRGAADARTGAEECCDLCGAVVAEDHRHLLDTGTDGGAELMCACRACSLLFADDAAGGGHYRLVPSRRLRLSPVDTAALGAPVGLAFFVVRQDGTPTGHWPSPAGATRWEADPGAWRRLVDGCPPLATLQPGVEALLVHTARGAEHHWIVPVDDCFRLVAVVRREWRGLSGGDRVWGAVDDFFAQLAQRP